MQYKWVALTVTLLGQLMSGLDDRILVIGLPTIAKQTSANVAQLIWFSQGYQLASTVALLLIGRMADVRGRVKMYNYGFAIFTIGSVIAATSISPDELITARLIQGLGSCMLSANSLAIVTDATPKNELGSFIGMNQMAFRTGALMGLTVTGVILSFADWRALFYINIPIGIVGTLWSRWKLREVAHGDTERRIDWPGFAAFTPGLTLILVGISFIGDGPSAFVQSLWMIGAGAALLTAFVLIEERSEAPLLDFKILKIKVFAGGSAAALLNTLAWGGMLVMISLFLQLVLGYSPLQAGLSVLPLDATMIIIGPLAGRLSDKHQSRIIPIIGLVVGAAGLLSLATLGVSASYLAVAIALVAISAGQGMFSSPNSRSIMASVPANRRGIAAAFRGTLNNIGDTAGPGIAVTLITIGIPYGSLTSVIQNSGVLVGQLSRDQFVTGFKIAAIALAGVDLAAIVPSVLKGRGQTSEQAPATSRGTGAPKTDERTG